LSRAAQAEPLHVACAVEGASYLRHCAAMLHSLLANHPGEPVRIEYLHCGDTSARARLRLAAMVAALGGEIAFHHIPDRWTSGLPVRGFTRKATWYRIFLDELLPEVPRILYLDVDLVVLEPLGALWRTDLGGCLVAAVTNVPLPEHRAYCERPQLGGDPYFNAGVLLLDLERLRGEGIGERLRSFSREHASRLHWRDQDALNEVLHDRRLPLHPRWNCMNALTAFPWASDYFQADQLAAALRQPAIRHFEGPAHAKPWHLLSTPEAQRLYLHHRRQTPWPRSARSGATPRNILRWTRTRLRSSWAASRRVAR
jgi:lipopolysaccharide biosynthesis glycosyltransferase